MTCIQIKQQSSTFELSMVTMIPPRCLTMDDVQCSAKIHVLEVGVSDLYSFCLEIGVRYIQLFTLCFLCIIVGIL